MDKSYSLTKKMMFNGMLKISEKLIYAGEFIAKKSAVKNACKFKSVESAAKWINEPGYIVEQLGEGAESGLNMQVLGDLKEPLHKFIRSKILLDRGDDSPLAVFVCPEIGECRFIDDEYIFNLGINELYSSEKGLWMIDSDNKDDWNICIASRTKNNEIADQIELVAACVFSEENV